MRLMSMRYSGRARRIFIIGIRLCPPLKIFAPSPCCCSREMASRMLSGRRYSKDCGIIVSPYSEKEPIFAPANYHNYHADPWQGDAANFARRWGEAKVTATTIVKTRYV